MVGYKTAYKGNIENCINLNYLKDGETVTLKEERFDPFWFYPTRETLVEGYAIPGKSFYSMTLVGEVTKNEETGKLECSSFTDVQEIPEQEIIEIIQQNYEELFKSKNPFIRKAVVRAGYKLEEALNDEATCVRVEVAQQGKYLDVLENDTAAPVLYAVVKQNHNLRKFLRHPDYDVRLEAQKRYEQQQKGKRND